MTAAAPQPLEASSFFDTIRRGCADVSSMARHVKIRHDLLPVYADNLPERPPANVLDTGHHFTGTEEATAAYILALDAINFGSGYEPHLVDEGWKLIDHSIYYTISTKLKKLFESKEPLTARDMEAFTPADAVAVLGLGKGRYTDEFALLCAQSLSETGRMMSADFGGSFSVMVNRTGGRVENLIRTLIKMHHFNDVHRYRGRMIAFYKRGQITAADLHLAYGRRGRELFADIGHLTMFPDNGVAHVFHTDGILEYTPVLAERIARGDEIPSGSEEEVEIRACALHTVELIAGRKGMRAMDVDHILWHRSVEDARYRKVPSHRTLSRFY